jgi:hypothetical protein
MKKSLAGTHTYHHYPTQSTHTYTTIYTYIYTLQVHTTSTQYIYVYICILQAHKHSICTDVQDLHIESIHMQHIRE